MRLVPDLVLAALVAGAGIGVWLDRPLASSLPLLLVAAAALAAATGMRLFRLPAGPLLLAAALVFGIWRAESAADPLLPTIPTGSEINASVRIDDAPAVSSAGYRFRARVVADADDRSGDLPPGTNLLIYAPPPNELAMRRGRPHLRYGDTLRLSGSVERPEPIGDFDYAAWLESQGIAGVMWSRHAELVSTGDGSKPAAALHRARSALASAIQRAMPAPESGLAQALLLGIRSDLPQAVKESFRTAGMSHLLAISGLHVGIAMTLTLGGAGAVLGRNHPATVAIAALVVWAYAVLSGLDPPVVRAAIMGSLFLAQGLLGRGMRGLTALLLAAAAMALIDPSLLSSLSFQLSFTAMAGVILGLPLITAANAALSAMLDPAGSWALRWGQHGLSLLMASAVISTTTSLATLPLVAWHFGEIPLMSVPATILAMPAMAAALVGAAATALAGLVAPPLAVALGTLTWASLGWLINVAEAMPPLMLTAPWLTGPVAAAWLGTLGLLATLASSRRARRAVASLRRRPRWQPRGSAGFIAAALPVALIVALLLAGQIVSTRADGLLRVYALDIGQGDAILIVTPEGRRMLVDGGPDPRTAVSAVSSLMPPGDRTLDLVAATHLDSDHAGGLLGILDRYRAGSVLQGGEPSRDSSLYPQWHGILQHRGHPVASIQAGHRIQLGRDVALEVLHPPGDRLPAGVERTSNNRSVVLRLDHRDVSFLLTGDIEADAERHLAAVAGEALRADVLKVAHHGSRTSTTRRFLDAVDPRSAVISAGHDNRFGHPHAEVMERLEAAIGADRVFLTSRDGTVEYISDGASLWVRTHGAAGR